MPVEIQPEKDSPYSEKLKRPESATKAPVVTPHNAKQRCESAKPSTTRKGSPGKRHKKKRIKDETEKEIAYVSKEVKRKLELYMNEEKRENRFNVGGAATTTHRMAEFDIAYKLLEYDKLEKKSPRNPKVTGQKKGGHRSKSPDPYNIKPKLTETSRRVTGYSEADRLSKYASEVFSSYPVEKLAKIHRYRPHPKDNQKSPELGNVLGYTGHVGAALHQQTYVDFYIREGMDSGDPRKSARLQTLPKKKASQSNSRRASDASSKQSSSQDSKHSSEKKSQKSKVTGAKSKPRQTKNVCESTEDSTKQSAQDDAGSSSTTKEEYYSETYLSSSTEDSSDNKQPQRSKPKHQSYPDSPFKELNQKSKDSLDKTWAYYESGSMKDSESTREQGNDSDVTEKANTADHRTDEGYTYSDGENNNLVEETPKGENTNERSDTEDTDKEIDGKGQQPDRQQEELGLRSYTAVEHVREVDIADI